MIEGLSQLKQSYMKFKCKWFIKLNTSVFVLWLTLSILVPLSPDRCLLLKSISLQLAITCLNYHLLWEQLPGTDDWSLSQQSTSKLPLSALFFHGSCQMSNKLLSVGGWPFLDHTHRALMFCVHLAGAIKPIWVAGWIQDVGSDSDIWTHTKWSNAPQQSANELVHESKVIHYFAMMSTRDSLNSQQMAEPSETFVNTHSEMCWHYCNWCFYTSWGSLLIQLCY